MALLYAINEQAWKTPSYAARFVCDTMIVKINPAWIPGRWRLGVSLDTHSLSSEFLGYDENGHPRFDTVRTPIGELLYRIKYASDFGAAEDIADTAASYLHQLARPPFKFIANVIVVVPPSRPRPRQPLFEIASAIGSKLNVRVATDAILPNKPLPELKEVDDYTTRLDLLRGAYRVDTTKTSDSSVLLLDDLFRSGASLNSAANVLVDTGGVEDLCALAITRTRSNR